MSRELSTRQKISSFYSIADVVSVVNLAQEKREKMKTNLNIIGEQVPAIGLGTWLLSGEQCVQSIEHGLILGYRHIDTAQDYGNESEVGEGIQKAGIRRENLFLVTKVLPVQLFLPQDNSNYSCKFTKAPYGLRGFVVNALA